MKIALPVETNAEDTKICISFGRTDYFAIYDSETKSTKYIDNTANQSQGGAGIKASQNLIDNDTDVVITMGLGDNAANVLKLANIKVYEAQGSNVKANIDKALEGELPVLTQIHAGYHNHGGK